MHRNDIVAASEEDAEQEAGSSAQQDELNVIDSGSTNFESPLNPVDAGFQVSGKGDTFVFRRTPAPLWRFLPSRLPDSPVTVESLAHARWSFAFKCVLDQAGGKFLRGNTLWNDLSKQAGFWSWPVENSTIPRVIASPE